MEIRPILSALMRSKTGAVLVALQVALSLAILTNAMHIVEVRLQVAKRPSGMADESTLVHMDVRHLVKTGHEQQLQTQKHETALLRALSGVQSVAWVSQVPMSHSGSFTSVAASRNQVNEVDGVSFYISPDSLVKTWGLRLTEGRELNEADMLEIDATNSPRDLFPDAVLVSQALARRVWPNQTTYVGQMLYFGSGEDANVSRVVGVIDTLQSHNAGVGERGYYTVVTPTRLTNAYATIYTIRTAPGQRERVMKEAAEAMRKGSPTPLIIETRSAEGDRVDRYRNDMALAWMLIAVCALLLLITASGIVGMASLWVTQRRKQIGVRRALGARRADILRYFVTENVMITSCGIVTGAALALGLNQLLVARLDMARLPPAYLGIGAVLLLLLGVGAVWGPAWRAASISPALATRSA